MKKLLFIAALLCGIASSNAATIATNLGSGLNLVSTNRASVYSIELTSTNAATVTLYDCDHIAYNYALGNCFGTNYTNAAFVTVINYSTNLTTSFVGYNGYTNWYTNNGTFISNLTNSIATNNLPIIGGFAIAPSTYAVYNTEMLFVRGIIANSTAANVGIVVNYRTAQ